MLYDIPHDPKMLHEAMCTAQGLIYRRGDVNSAHYADIIGDIIKECERHRPLGSNGKHGNLHTDTCGCEDKV